MKINNTFIQLVIVYPAIVYSAEIWTSFDMALGYKASRILNNVVLSFLKEPEASILMGEMDLINGIMLPSNKIEYVSSDYSLPELEKSYISLITKIMKAPILDHGSRFKEELEKLSMALLYRTYSNIGSTLKERQEMERAVYERGISLNSKTRLTEMEQTQIVNILIAQLCKITELANSYWDEEVDELVNVFLSNLGYRGKNLSKIHNKCLYDYSEKLNRRQRMEFERNFDDGIRESQSFVLNLDQKIKDFSDAVGRYGNNDTGFDKGFLKRFPHEYHSFLDWYKLHGYLEKFKADLLTQIGLNRNRAEEAVQFAIRYISGAIVAGDYVKIIRKRKIEGKVYKVLRIQKKLSMNVFSRNRANEVLLYDFETGERFRAEYDVLIRTMNIACFQRNVKNEFIKELAVIDNFDFAKSPHSNLEVKENCGDIILAAITSMISDHSKLKKINMEQVVSAIEILNYSLRFNEFPNGVDNDLDVPGSYNVQSLTTPNLMKCGSPLLIHIVNKYNSLTGRFPDLQNCSVETTEEGIERCKPVSIEFDKFKGWQKAFKVLYSSAIPDLSLNDDSFLFWTSSIRSNRNGDLKIPRGYADCDKECLKDLLLKGGLQNNIVLDVLGQISWHLSSDMILLDKLVAKFYSIFSVLEASTEPYDAPSVSSEIYNVLKYTVCDDGCYTYEPDSVILGCFRWLETESNHVQNLPLINFYYLAFSIHTRFVELLKAYKRLNSSKFTKKFSKSLINKYYKLQTVYTLSEFVPPQNYPLASFVLQIAFFLNEYLEGYKSKVIGVFPKNFGELANGLQPSSFSNVNKVKKGLKILKKYAIEFIFRFMSNNTPKRKGGVLNYVKNKMKKFGRVGNQYLRIINDSTNANLKYGPLAVTTVLSWALSGRDINPRLNHRQWNTYVPNLFSSDVPNYRKLFFYMILNDAKSPDQVAWNMIAAKCKIGNSRAVKKNLINVLSSSDNILLVIDMAAEIARDCNNNGYDIKNSRLFTESSCHNLKLKAIKQIRSNGLKIVDLIKSHLNIPKTSQITNDMVEKCDWFYDTKYYKLAQRIVGGDGNYSINIDLVKTIKLYFGYKDFEYEYVPKDIFVAGVYDYFSPLFYDRRACNNTSEKESAKCHYDNFIKETKRQILLQQVYDGQVYVLKNPVQSKYKFGRIFLTESTLNNLLSSGIEIPECEGRCNVGNFRRVLVKNLSNDEFGAPIFKPQINEADKIPLNVVYFNSIIFDLYQVKDIVSGEIITIDDVNLRKNIIVCADDDFYHNNIDIEAIKHNENEGGSTKYPAFGYKFLKKHNLNHLHNKCGYFFVKILPNLPGDSRSIIDPIEAEAKRIAQIVASVT